MATASKESHRSLNSRERENPYRSPIPTMRSASHVSTPVWIGRIACLLVACWCLWLLPITSSDDVSIFGIFGWLAVFSEVRDPQHALFIYQGCEVTPTPWGLPANLIATICCIRVVLRGTSLAQPAG